MIPTKCKKCGSENITKLSVHQQKSKKGFGCVGCLLIVIIIILIWPVCLAVAGLGTVAGAMAVVGNQSASMVIAGVIFGVWVLSAWNKSRSYICERCGKVFK